MSVIGDLKQEIQDLETLAEVTLSFTEINSLKIKKIRASFERNRRFYEEIQAVFHLVNLYSQKRQPKLKRLKRPEMVQVAVTSNSRFYGSLNLRAIDEFEKNLVPKSELMIIGRTGVSYANSKKNFPKFEPIKFKKDLPSGPEVVDLVKSLEDYQKVLVYYPQFVTVISQKISRLDITQSIEEGELPENQVEIIFEPEVEQMGQFFSQQMRAVLLNRVFLETDLSWTSARLMAMSEASEKDAALAKSRRVDLNNALRAWQNARLIETFSSLVGWRRNG